MSLSNTGQFSTDKELGCAGKIRQKIVLFWGRFDPEYSRNRIVRQLLVEAGWSIVDFRPLLSSCGDLEALLRRLPSVQLVWVPCFRQRDVAAAASFCRRRRVPLLFDPLISAYDKQVFEKRKLPKSSFRAKRLLRREQSLLQQADLVLADTRAHADFFHDTLGVEPERLCVVPVGAEEGMFHSLNQRKKACDAPLEVFFYGSFIPLQGPQVIVEAARRYRGPSVVWRLLGDGPLRNECERLAADLPQVQFEDWISYPLLPERIARADILLGIFGITPKAQRVIPNKVYQAAACGKPLVTMRAPSFPVALQENEGNGFFWVDAGDANALAAVVARLAAQPQRLPELGRRARQSYDEYFSVAHIRVQLRQVLDRLGLD